MSALGFDGFVSGIASVIASHVGVAEPPRVPDVRDAEIPASAAVQVAPAPARETYLLDVEKVVFHFPDAASRIIEDAR